MNLDTQTHEDPEVNLTSLIDVVLLLLVFFMVSTSFVRESELKIQLPEADRAAAGIVSDEQIEITITAEGGYFVNGRALVNNRPDTLRRALEKTVGERRDMPLTIRADAGARHQGVVTAMDVAGRMGFVQINIATMNIRDAG